MAFSVRVAALGFPALLAGCVDMQRPVELIRDASVDPRPDLASPDSAAPDKTAVDVASEGAPERPATGVRVLLYGPVNADFERPYLPAGSAVTVAGENAWRAMSTTEFAAFDLIVFGDPSTSGSGQQAVDLEAAVDTRETWTPAVTGPVIVLGLDVGYHAAEGAQGAVVFAKAALAWAAGGGKTGLFVSTDVGRRMLEHLGGFGPFDSEQAEREGVHISDVAHPCFDGSSDATLSDWSVSLHSVIRVFPSDFQAVAHLAGDPGAAVVVIRESR